MADVIDVQIKAVEAEIADVKDEIKEDSEQLKLILAQLADPGLREERRPELLEEKRRLGAEVQRLGKEMEGLRTKEHDLREKEKLLMAKQQQGAGCRSWPATIICAHTLVACLSSCHVP